MPAGFAAMCFSEGEEEFSQGFFETVASFRPLTLPVKHQGIKLRYAQRLT